MATSRHLSIAQTGSNFENFNFFVVFSAYRVQKSKIQNLSHTNVQLAINWTIESTVFSQNKAPKHTNQIVLRLGGLIAI
jgi:hypothetical protein